MRVMIWKKTQKQDLTTCAGSSHISFSGRVWHTHFAPQDADRCFVQTHYVATRTPFFLSVYPFIGVRCICTVQLYDNTCTDVRFSCTCSVHNTSFIWQHVLLPAAKCHSLSSWSWYCCLWRTLIQSIRIFEMQLCLYFCSFKHSVLLL